MNQREVVALVSALSVPIKEFVAATLTAATESITARLAKLENRVPEKGEKGDRGDQGLPGVDCDMEIIIELRGQIADLACQIAELKANRDTQEDETFASHVRELLVEPPYLLSIKRASKRLAHADSP